MKGTLEEWQETTQRGETTTAVIWITAGSRAEHWHRLLVPGELPPSQFPFWTEGQRPVRTASGTLCLATAVHRRCLRIRSYLRNLPNRRQLPPPRTSPVFGLISRYATEQYIYIRICSSLWNTNDINKWQIFAISPHCTNKMQWLPAPSSRAQFYWEETLYKVMKRHIKLCKNGFNEKLLFDTLHCC